MLYAKRGHEVLGLNDLLEICTLSIIKKNYRIYFISTPIIFMIYFPVTLNFKLHSFMDKNTLHTISNRTPPYANTTTNDGHGGLNDASKVP